MTETASIRLQSAISFCRESGILFHVGYSLWAITAILNITYIPAEVIDLSWIYYLVPPLLLLNEVVVAKFDTKSALLLGSVCLLVALEYAAGGEALDAPLMLLFASRNVDFKSIVKNTIIIVGVLFCLTVLLALIGVISNTIDRRENSTIARYGLGFLGRTFPSYFVLALTLQCAFLIRTRKMRRLPSIAALFLLNMAVYLATNTRTGFLLTVCVLAAMLLSGKVAIPKKVKETFGALVIATIPLLAALSLVASQTYSSGSSIYRILDGVLSYRISYAAQAVSEYGLNLFGHKIPWQSLDYIVDNSYVRIALDNGLIAIVAIVIGLTVTVVRLVKCECYFTSFILLIIVIQAAIDPVLVTVYLNPFLLLITSATFWSPRLKRYKNSNGNDCIKRIK